MTDKLFNYYRIEKAISFLLQNYKCQPSLDEVAQNVCLSPHHFQKIFTGVGISPKKCIKYLTLGYLKTKIKETENI